MLYYEQCYGYEGTDFQVLFFSEDHQVLEDKKEEIATKYETPNYTPYFYPREFMFIDNVTDKVLPPKRIIPPAPESNLSLEYYTKGDMTTTISSA